MYAFMIFTDTYLSSETNVALEWTPPSNKRRTKVAFEINQRRGGHLINTVLANKYCSSTMINMYMYVTWEISSFPVSLYNVQAIFLQTILHLRLNWMGILVTWLFGMHRGGGGLEVTVPILKRKT